MQQRQRDKRIESYQQQLQLLRNSLTSTEMGNDINPELRQQMMVTVTARLQLVLPERTPWDEAYEFFLAA
jgi:hypothetical protein